MKLVVSCESVEVEGVSELILVSEVGSICSGEVESAVASNDGSSIALADRENQGLFA